MSSFCRIFGQLSGRIWSCLADFGFGAEFPARSISFKTLFPPSNSSNTHFLRRLSVTTHSTWSRRQLVQGEPLSTTSQRTFLARQQQHAREARLLMGRFPAASPAVEALRFFCDRAVSGGGEVVVEAILDSWFIIWIAADCKARLSKRPTTYIPKQEQLLYKQSNWSDAPRGFNKFSQRDHKKREAGGAGSRSLLVLFVRHPFFFPFVPSIYH